MIGSLAIWESASSWISNSDSAGSADVPGGAWFWHNRGATRLFGDWYHAESVLNRLPSLATVEAPCSCVTSTILGLCCYFLAPAEACRQHPLLRSRLDLSLRAVATRGLSVSLVLRSKEEAREEGAHAADP